MHTPEQACGTGHSSIEIAALTKQEPVAARSKNAAFNLPAASGSESDSINATEVEDDDDFEFCRKFPDSSSYFLNCLTAQVTGHLHRYRKDSLPCCTHFALIASNKYIIHRVIRI